MDSGKRGFHARSTYLTQDTSHMGTEKVKQKEEEEDTTIIATE